MIESLALEALKYLQKAHLKKKIVVFIFVTNIVGLGSFCTNYFVGLGLFCDEYSNSFNKRYILYVAFDMPIWQLYFQHLIILKRIQYAFSAFGQCFGNL